MRILYLGCHAVNEYEDIKLFSELGHEIVAMGVYNNPSNPGDQVRPALPEIYYNPEMAKVAATLVWNYERTSVIPDELIDWCDAIYILGRDIWLPFNWERIKKKIVIFRSHGQSIQSTENILRKYRREGLKIVRYSPLETRIPGYVGEDAMIRFYKDEDEYKGWNGGIEKVITVAQSMKGRTRALHFDLFEKVTRGLPRMLYGNGNEDTGELWGGKLTYEQLKQTYRDNRVFFYTGTYPAPYTMAFQEAFMTGIPVVSIGRTLAGFDLEVADFIENGVNGFVSDSLLELRNYVKRILDDYELAKRISGEGRKKAIELFGEEDIKLKWREFFGSLE
jgi:glycosyltransferase involved in cell wall biosynthesis